MKLPDNSVGISDINTWRDCPSRFTYQMRRWTDEGEPPESKHPDTMYGSAVHHGIEKMETELMSVEEAMQDTFNHWGVYLDPDTMERLEKDLTTYQRRDAEWATWKPVSVEDDFRVPLLEHEGETIYYRFKIDRLYQDRSDPTRFVHVDYKSSKWKKDQAEIDADPQMWSYNWGIHEIFPECQSLQQFYDQLMYGMNPTRKSPEQREQIKVWLQRQVTAILQDEEAEPKLNEWCPWCPILESCPEPRRSAEFTRARIAALAPEDQDTGKLDIDPDLIEVYVSESENAKLLIKALERFNDSINDVIRDMPTAVRTYHGYELGGKEIDVWTPDGLREAHRILGDDFYTLVKLGKTKLNAALKGDDRRDAVLDLSLKEGQNPSVKKIRSDS